MDKENLKKILLPGIVFVLVLIANTNSIINGINAHNTSRVVIAAISSFIVIVLLIFLLVRALRGGGKEE